MNSRNKGNTTYAFGNQLNQAYYNTLVNKQRMFKNKTCVYLVYLSE